MRFAVIVSANAEWESLKPMFRSVHIEHSPYGEYFFASFAAGHPMLFFHGGWGKVAAAASTQYVIDHFKPGFLVNLATRNNTSLLIVRGVTDLVSLDKAEAEGNPRLFRENARRVMQTLIEDLPMFISAILGAHAVDPSSCSGGL